MRPLSEFDPAWPHGHVTRDGKPARILGKINRDMYPLVVAAGEKGCTEVALPYTADGKLVAGEHSPSDLINAPAPKRRVQGWAIVFRSPNGSLYTSTIYQAREDAEARRCEIVGDLIACVFIDVEEGEGLS